MQENQQLIKRDIQTGGYNNIYPNTYIDLVSDRANGMPLNEIISGYNSYFVPWAYSVQETRLQVPSSVRRKGLFLTYVNPEDTVVIEWYNSDNIDDNSFQSDENWNQGSNMLVGDIAISKDGNWVINGVDTNIPARGPQGDKLLVRLSPDQTRVEYSYNDLDWEVLYPLDITTPKINIAPTISVDASENPSVTNLGNQFETNFQFSIPKAPDVSTGNIITLPAGSLATVSNSGTPYHVKLDFSIPMGNTGAKGEKGDGWSLKGFVDAVGNLPSSGNTLGDLYLVGTATPYQAYVWRGSTYRWVNIGSALEVKASIFDGGRADTKYGGTRTIDCGGADAYLTV